MQVGSRLISRTFVIDLLDECININLIEIIALEIRGGMDQEVRQVEVAPRFELAHIATSTAKCTRRPPNCTIKLYTRHRVGG
jgi:hypothetical protein